MCSLWKVIKPSRFCSSISSSWYSAGALSHVKYFSMFVRCRVLLWWYCDNFAKKYYLKWEWVVGRTYTLSELRVGHPWSKVLMKKLYKIAFVKVYNVRHIAKKMYINFCHSACFDSCYLWTQDHTTILPRSRTVYFAK